MSFIRAHATRWLHICTFNILWQQRRFVDGTFPAAFFAGCVRCSSCRLCCGLVLFVYCCCCCCYFAFCSLWRWLHFATFFGTSFRWLFAACNVARVRLGERFFSTRRGLFLVYVVISPPPLLFVQFERLLTRVFVAVFIVAHFFDSAYFFIYFLLALLAVLLSCHIYTTELRSIYVQHKHSACHNM